MIFDIASEVTILQEWWFNEYLIVSVDSLEDALSWLRFEAANYLVFPYIGYFTADIKVLGTIVKNKGILVQKDTPGLNHHRQTSGILGMNILGATAEIRELLRIIETHDRKPKREIEGRVMNIAGDTSENIPAWSSCNTTVSGPRCSGNGMVEPSDEPLKGGLLLQAGLVGYINGCFGVTIVKPTPNEVWLRSHSPIWRIYTVDVINRDPVHKVGFQELDDGLRVSLEPRQTTANTRWVSSKQSHDISELPSDQGWMRDVSIGDLPPN